MPDGLTLSEIIAIATVALTTVSFAVTLVVFVYKVGVWRRTTDKDLQQLRDTADSDRKDFRETIDNYRQDSRETIQEIREDIREIRSNIENLFIRTTLPPPSSQPITSSSPLSLTDFGEKIARDLGAAHWVNKTAPEVWSYAQTLIEDYEVQGYCFKYVRHYLSDEMETRIKRTAYEYGTDIEGVYNVLAIVLRDKLLEKRRLGEGLSPTEE
ncbi:MAG: hypothetical protein OXD43_10145 [Bacteroidetes bacterium]|nr:hypothetical protein [Bacteroidota bacterium]